MSQLVSSLSPQHLPDHDDQHSGHLRRLVDGRRFRVEQLAALEVDLSVTEPDRGVKLALHIAATAALSEIDAALARMHSGRYGQCVNCGQPIEAARLDALPMAPLCMPCHYNEEKCRLAASRTKSRS
jgi:RNA polymerase-binding transcription factor DksA